MVWIITKQWRDIPASKQPATQERFPTREEAEIKMELLRADFPDRELEVCEVN